jgi:hypothetical protein
LRQAGLFPDCGYVRGGGQPQATFQALAVCEGENLAQAGDKLLEIMIHEVFL